MVRWMPSDSGHVMRTYVISVMAMDECPDSLQIMGHT